MLQHFSTRTVTYQTHSRNVLCPIQSSVTEHFPEVVWWGAWIDRGQTGSNLGKIHEHTRDFLKRLLVFGFWHTLKSFDSFWAWLQSVLIKKKKKLGSSNTVLCWGFFVRALALFSSDCLEQLSAMPDTYKVSGSSMMQQIHQVKK